MSEIWLAILVIGIATYATRVAPLLWERWLPLAAARGGWLDRLGPCLIAAMAATVILPPFLTAEAALDILPELTGLAAVAAVMRLRADPGLATLGGMAAYYLAG
ncbi:AzlD domain-containing protein [Cereibacter sphaeroides]|uniref:AzlD domain-containing protein n=1 Tax=Cereibacter sphaeroides TaxID=1063 RepID=UPI003FCD92E4